MKNKKPHKAKAPSKPLSDASNIYWIAENPHYGIANDSLKRFLVYDNSGAVLGQFDTQDTAAAFAQAQGPNWKLVTEGVRPLSDSATARSAKVPMSKVTAFDIASLAACLAAKDSNAHRKPDFYLQDARDLIERAAEYLDAETRAAIIPFELLLKSGQPESGNAGKTLSSGITTMQGLKKAIQRVFDWKTAQTILLFGGMTQDELDDLKAKLRAYRSKAAKNGR